MQTSHETKSYATGGGSLRKVFESMLNRFSVLRNKRSDYMRCKTDIYIANAKYICFI